LSFFPLFFHYSSSFSSPSPCFYCHFMPFLSMPFWAIEKI
jgi:hypothetical protein